MRKKILILVSLFIMLIGLSSCRDPLDPLVEGDFLYVKSMDNMNKRCISIMGLSEEGLKKETIVIPTTINNLEVKYFGAEFAWRTEGEIISDNLKNIYVHDQFEKYVYHGFFAELEDVNVYCGYSYQNLREYGYSFTLCGNIFVPKRTYDSWIDYDVEGDEFHDQIIYANVVYYLNNPTGDTFFVDDCDGTIVNVIPPNPRREGYKFKGWYKEKECINKWDFEKDIIPAKEYDSEGNYIFKETQIYAGWEIE